MFTSYLGVGEADSKQTNEMISGSKSTSQKMRQGNGLGKGSQGRQCGQKPLLSGDLGEREPAGEDVGGDSAPEDQRGPGLRPGHRVVRTGPQRGPCGWMQ